MNKMIKMYWSYTYKLIPRVLEDKRDQKLHDLVMESWEEKNATVIASTCADRSDGPETPESIIEYLNKTWPLNPEKVLIDKREITKEEYEADRAYKEALVHKEAVHLRGLLNLKKGE